jgi:hypothetical protein
MKSNYKIQINIKIVECNDETQLEPHQQKEGHFEFVISEELGCNIDKCEQALLQTNYPALREALSAHLTQVSKKKACQTGSEHDIYVNEVPYRVDGEIGCFTFNTHYIQTSGQPIFNTSFDIFPALKGKELYRTQGFKELAIVHGGLEQSYRDTQELLNRVRYQPDATKLRTLSDSTESEGQQLQVHIEQQATKILSDSNFCPIEGTPSLEQIDSYHSLETVKMPTNSVKKVLDSCSSLEPELKSAIENNPVPYEEPSKTVSVSIDDVGVKKQKEHRVPLEKKDQKYVHNTVIHIENEQDSYMLNGYGVSNVLRLSLAFLLNNDLLKNNLIFFVDGQKTLQEAIIKSFSWFSPVQIILDWYHLKKKCDLQFSLGLTGYKLTASIRSEVKHLLWYGTTDKAIESLKKIDTKNIKNQCEITKLINYLERSKPYIPCYAARKQLGLRNSSNLGEKANDLLVSDRQKHNGMSWSKVGSVALASLTALVKNGEYKKWFETKTIKFGFAS